MRALTTTRNELKPATNSVMSIAHVPNRRQNEERRLSSRTGDASEQSFTADVDGAGTAAYGEEAFRYLLGLERKRAGRSGRPFLLLLVDLKKTLDDPEMGADAANWVFSGLAASLRDTDFVGWYREGRVAGAVLAQLSDAGDSDIAQIVRDRVQEKLLAHVPASIAHRLQTRVFQLPRKCRS